METLNIIVNIGLIIFISTEVIAGYRLRKKMKSKISELQKIIDAYDNGLKRNRNYKELRKILEDNKLIK